MKRQGVSVVVTAALLATGCVGDGTGPGEASWIHASVTGERSGSFGGSGVFAFDRDYAETPYYFKVYTRSSEPGTAHALYLRWPTTRRPGRGVHHLVPHDHQHGSFAGATAVFVWSEGDDLTGPAEREVYVAASGTVEVLRSTRRTVEGAVRLTAVQTERSGAAGAYRLDPRHQPDPSAPTVEVTGTFRVTRVGRPERVENLPRHDR